MKDFNYLENSLLKLRALEPSDVDLLYIWENDTSLWRVSNTLTPFSKNTLRKYIDAAHLDIYQTQQLRLMIDVKNEGVNKTVGAIDLFDFDPFHLRAGIGLLIADPSDRRKGYASGALEILIKYCFEVLHLHQIFCNITTDNEASIQLFKKAGFSIIGEKKEWIKTPKGWLGEHLLQIIND